MVSEFANVSVVSLKVMLLPAEFAISPSRIYLPLLNIAVAPLSAVSNFTLLVELSPSVIFALVGDV